MNTSGAWSSWFRAPHIKITILLFLAVLVINVVAVWGIISAHRSARGLALRDMELEAVAHARSVEATLATRRGDGLFLAQSRPFSSAPSLLTRADPLARRWG